MLDDFLFGVTVEVDQDVPDEHAVERRFVQRHHQVVMLEGDELLQLGPYLPAVAVHRGEMAPERALLNALDGPRPEDPLARIAERLLADVRSEHCERPVPKAMSLIAQADGDRVGLGPRRASRRPDPE